MDSSGKRLPCPSWAVAGLVILVVLFAVTGTASAQKQGIGVRGGASVDPDQFYFGLHYDTGPLVDRLSFRPNVEAGFGDGKTLVTFNFEFAYRIPIPKKAWSLYAGGGPAAVVTNVDHDGESNTDVGGGFNLLIGVSHDKGLFAELKVGVIDSPSLKIGVGYSF
jgi:hypothetical protein